MAEQNEDGSESLNNSLDLQDLTDPDENNPEPSSNVDMVRKRRRMNTPSPHGFTVPASPPQFVSLDQLMAAANGVKNMSLVHEIAVDNDFRFQKTAPEPNSLEHQVRETIHRAFWDHLEDSLNSTPPNFSHALVLIADVKEILLSLLMPQHVRFRTLIMEVLDMDLIQQKIFNSAFDLYYYADFVMNLIAKLCAPVRDEKIAALREIKEVIPLFRELFEVLDLMKMDMANFTVQQLRPYLQQQSAEYERKKFQDFIKLQEEHGTDGLEYTKEWLTRCYNKLDEQCQNSTNSAAMTTPASIMNAAFLELLNWDAAQTYPETLLMDQLRFQELQRQIKQLTLIAAMLLVTYNTVGSPISGIHGLKETLKKHSAVILAGASEKELPDKMINAAVQINKEVNQCLVKHGFQEQNESQQRLLIGQIEGVAKGDNAVYSVISKRALDFVTQSLSSQHVEPLQVPAGFSAVEKELTGVCGQFLRLISHNRSVFGPYYVNIIGVLLKRTQEDLSPRS